MTQRIEIKGREYDDISLVAPQTMSLVLAAYHESDRVDMLLQQAFARDDVEYAVDVEELGDIVALNFRLRAQIERFLARREHIGYGSEE